jgi:uncharacterized protein (TIGR00661 family)
MRVAFFIQGEGRGHMTQALALKRILEDAGHEIVAAFMGENSERPIPQFFVDRFQGPIHTYLSPVFVIDPSQKGVRLGPTVLNSLRQAPRYWSQGSTIHRDLSAYAPDLLVNFYELLGGIYHAVFRPRVPMVAVGHQFLFFHPALPTPDDQSLQIRMIRLHARLNSLNADLRLGLSFTPLPNRPEMRMRIVPPLLREAVLEGKPTRGDHVLAYVLNPGYGEELERWHAEHPEVVLHCFWDKQDAPPVYSPRENLTYHRLDDRKFLELLSTCRGFTSTAGFESVCEAAFWGKPIMVVPTGNHLEQRCNALDAQRAGVATWRDDFHLTDFVKSLDAGTPSAHGAFGTWVKSAPDSFIRLLEGLCEGRNPMTIPLDSDSAVSQGE